MAGFTVLGGGVSGLSTAWYLAQRLPRTATITVVEGSDRLGGWVRTEQRAAGGAAVLAEKGPRTLRTGVSREALAVLELVDDLDLRSAVVTAARSSAAARNRFIYYGGELNRMPSGLASLVGGLPPAARCLARGVWQDLTTRSSGSGSSDESIHDFVARRFGAAVDDNLASAVMRGIYAADTRDLSARALLFPFWLADRTGTTGVLRGLPRVAKLSRARNAVHAQRDAAERKAHAERRRRHPGFWEAVDGASMYSFADGMQTLTDALASALRTCPNVSVLTGSPAVALRARDGCAEVALADGRTLLAHHVVSALPTRHLASLLGGSAVLDMPYASVAVVNVAYSERNVTPVDGFGYLVPRAAASPSGALGVVFDSRALPPQDRGAPVDRLTVMLGLPTTGGSSTAVTTASVEEAALQTLREHLRIAQAPVDVDATIATHCIPTYTVGYVDRLADIHKWVASQLNGRLSVVGAAFGGPAVPQCVLHARDLVQRHLHLDDLEAPQNVTGLEEIIKGFDL
ncbi:oxygen-dependent protoporphyrinogen oxidase [Coemansia aciculifera]|uniref:Oxygen-dependent protoporphyrinogen oxidase n=1 Tax=Coemansia aciculifera TaxID=417176 RepID=A0ACC1M4A9_9FUNG|nr:oxygen-dependent protoporphyrinogen oxidase [Coemansia aciculifera]KAJ2909685.1 oxygen-dependent protoporphyrinogen oxidase [Coemansia aciculifera]